MITINAKENNVISFETTIDGNIKMVESVSIIIPTSRGFDLKIPAKFDNNVVECQIPVLYDILDKGSYPFIMEMVIDGKKFEPLTEELFVESPLEVKAKVVSEQAERVEESVAPVIKTSVRSSVVKKVPTHVEL